MIRTEQWKPKHEPLSYPEELVRWIDSINNGFGKRETYEPYNLYCKQAAGWLKQTDNIEDYQDIDEQRDFVKREYAQGYNNTLYFLNKFLFLKEGDIDGGGMGFNAYEAQKIICFLFDCGYNLMVGKPRQIGFTTVLGGCGIKRINLHKSYFVKFITHTKEKGEEIFEDKIKWAFGRLPSWYRQAVYNDSHSILGLKEKSKKGETKGAHSKLQVVTPAIDAINGGSPNLVLVDEIGLMSTFGKMMKEGRPAMFFYNPKTEKLEMRRQFIGWGTGGQMDRAGAVFEAEFKAAMKAWEERDYDYGIIPIFFDAFAKEGMTNEQYHREKKHYYSIDGAEQESSRVQFHQHYPVTMEDMFLRTSRTIIPISECNKHLLRINQLETDDKPQYGYFEARVDKSQRVDDSDIPYKITGATWMPTKGIDDARTTSVIFRHPDKGWAYRYFQGTDPINSETGHSKMASAVWDSLTNTVSCVVNFRTKTFKECYLQCLLAGLYYDSDGAKELTESNIGDMYIDYKDAKGFGKSIVPNTALPVSLQTPSSKWWGISNRTNTAGRITNRTIELIDLYANNIYIPWFFIQLKTYIEKSLSGQNQIRQTRYQAADMKYDYDDVVDAITFAYINAEAHSRYEPFEKEKTNERKEMYRYVQDASTNFRLRLAVVGEDGRVKKYVSDR
jgi:hypothetical protein